MLRLADVIRPPGAWRSSPAGSTALAEARYRRMVLRSSDGAGRTAPAPLSTDRGAVSSVLAGHAAYSWGSAWEAGEPPKRRWRARWRRSNRLPCQTKGFELAF